VVWSTAVQLNIEKEEVHQNDKEFIVVKATKAA